MSAKGKAEAGGEAKPGAWEGCVGVYKKRRSKTDWAGLGIGDAFKPNLDYFLRLSSQRLFYAACRNIQLAAARLTGFVGESGYQPKTRPQLGPCYTTYPSALAAYAAVGLTGYLEFEAAAGGGALAAHLDAYLKNPAAYDTVQCDPVLYQRVARVVVNRVQTRLLLEDLSRSSGLSLVELYRLFSASQQGSSFASLPDIISAVVLYGDLLPDWEDVPLHPVTRSLLDELDAVCSPYFKRLADSAPQTLAMLGLHWVRDLCQCLAKHVPPPKPSEGEPASAARADNGLAGGPSAQGLASAAPSKERIAPFNGLNPPALFAPPTVAERAAAAFLGGDPFAEQPAEPSMDALRVMRALARFSRVMEQAAGQKGQWVDMRSDLVERAMMRAAFAESPIQGSPTDGHDVKIRLGTGEEAGGEIYDRPVELSDDQPGYEQLAGESQPIADALRRALYPNMEERVEAERLRATGSLDPARLAMADYSTAVFRRYRICEKADRKGQPLLLIACDGSGSLNKLQMRMLKVLAAAWLSSTARTHVQVMAGLYHSGEVRKGISGPLVQWIYHPQKTPAVSRKDALRALVSLPDTGTGTQSDALSLGFMIREAAKIARGRMIYLILLSDCQWNRSFSIGKSGAEEVHALFDAVYEDLSENLHATLVALGYDGATGFEDVLDKVIAVPEGQLADVAGLAEQIGVYVASCMKERRTLMARG